MAVSKDDFVRKLFPEAARTSEVNTKKLALISVSSKFRVRSTTILPRASAHSVQVPTPNLTTLWSCGFLHVTPHHTQFLHRCWPSLVYRTTPNSRKVLGGCIALGFSIAQKMLLAMCQCGLISDLGSGFKAESWEQAIAQG